MTQGFRGVERPEKEIGSGPEKFNRDLPINRPVLVETPSHERQTGHLLI
jgi:hypothetical protein